MLDFFVELMLDFFVEPLAGIARSCFQYGFTN